MPATATSPARRFILKRHSDACAPTPRRPRRLPETRKPPLLGPQPRPTTRTTVLAPRAAGSPSEFPAPRGIRRTTKAVGRDSIKVGMLARTANAIKWSSLSLMCRFATACIPSELAGNSEPITTPKSTNIQNPRTIRLSDENLAPASVRKTQTSPVSVSDNRAASGPAYAAAILPDWVLAGCHISSGAVGRRGRSMKCLRRCLEYLPCSPIWRVNRLEEVTTMRIVTKYALVVGALLAAFVGGTVSVCTHLANDQLGRVAGRRQYYGGAQYAYG